MNLNKKVNVDNFYFDFVNILNGILQLSNREAEVFSYLLMADAGKNGYPGDVNNREVRKVIETNLGISEANLSRYLNTIKSKGLIVRSSKNKWAINDNIKPVVEYNEKTGEPEVKINFILNINTEKNVDKVIGEYTKDV